MNKNFFYGTIASFTGGIILGMFVQTAKDFFLLVLAMWLIQIGMHLITKD